MRTRLLLGLLLTGCTQAPSGCSAHATSRGPLTVEERAALPGAIAFVSERAGHKDVWLVTPLGGERRLTQQEGDEFPAGQRPGSGEVLVVAAREEAGGHLEQLLLQPLDGGEAHALTPPSPRARHPTWAPDGRWLVAEWGQEGFSDLARFGVGEAQGTQLVREEGGCFEPALSPDGTHLAYVSVRDGDPEVYVRRLEDGSEVRLTSFHAEDTAPHWSPDGRHLAFLSNREGRERVYLVRSDGTGVRAAGGAVTKGEEREPAFSPDGRTLVFVERGPRGTARLWQVAVEGGAPRALTEGTARDEMPAFSPDGRALVFVSNRTGDDELFLMRADGSGLVQLTRSPGADWLPRWVQPQKGTGYFSEK